ncbi:hypothetical protein Ddye_028019 [Dipteronia dyeriana]|uniref:Reverse transcriptase zinc-binding domain-containing protein n=1 Tax=Dipteronia dyeriana TaxID=168575 RepID=A0AAD9TQ68_9ROSI|nr:hypothetical protein Ddye_028019 [Dipteronia dyeriana]
MPVGVALAVEKLQRGFLWGDGGSKRKIHAVKWEEVCKSKSVGGLGIGRVLVKNNGLLTKWIWRFGRERDALWHRVLVAKYEFLLWPLRKVVMFRILGGGCRQGGFVMSKLDVFCLIGKRSGVWVFNLMLDVLAWNLNRNGMYTVSSFRRSFEGNSEVYSSIQMVIWNGICPYKVEVFLWQLYRGRVFVREVLLRFGMAKLNVVVCPLCSLEVETVDHLFLHCPWTFNLWNWCMGKGVGDSVSVLMLNLKDACVESMRVKNSVTKDLVPPLMNTFKFNVDGSVRGLSGQAGMGGILRDCNGRVVCLFSFFIGSMDSNAAKVMAIHKAIEICSSSYFLSGQMVSIVSDSKVVVSWIHNEDFGSLD